MIVLLAGCDEGPPAGLCRGDVVPVGYCEVHGGEGLLHAFTVDVDDAFEASEVRRAARWDADPHGFSDVQWGGPRGEHVYLYSASEGRLRRGHWNAGEVRWEAKDLFIEGRFDGVVIEHYGDEDEGYDLALFVDSHEGRAESWRVSGQAERMWSHEDPRWRGRPVLNWLPKTDHEPGVLATRRGAHESLTFSLTTQDTHTLSHDAAELRRFTHHGNRYFGLTRERMTSGASTPTRLRLFEVDALGNEVHPIFEQEEPFPLAEVQLLARTNAHNEVEEVLIWRYDSRLGRGHVTRVDPDSGELIRAHGWDLPMHWSATSLTLVGGELRILGLDAEGMAPLPRHRLEAMVESIQLSMQHRVGYQFILAQSGRILHEEAGGWSRLPSEQIPLGAPMRTESRMNVASISKLITAATVLRLVDADRVELDRNFIDYLRPSVRKEADPSWSGLTVRELLNHQSAIPERACEVDADGVPACASLLRSERELWRCERDDEGHPCCPADYRNGNYHLLRYMLGHLLDLEDNADVARYTSQDWLEDIGVHGAKCSPHPDDRYYRRDGPSEFDFVELEPRREDGCGQSGWHLSARDLIRIARAIRYGWVLSEEMSAELLSCAEFGWLAWDAGFTHMTSRAKNGRLDNSDYGVQTIIARLPEGLDMVLMTNNADPGTLGPVLDSMWNSF